MQQQCESSDRNELHNSPVRKHVILLQQGQFALRTQSRANIRTFFVRLLPGEGTELTLCTVVAICRLTTRHRFEAWTRDSEQSWVGT